MRLRATIILEYEVNPSAYEGVTDPEEMVRIDAESDLGAWIEFADVIKITGEEIPCPTS